MSTIFSRIIEGELPADIVYQDDLVTCFATSIRWLPPTS